MFFRWPSSRSWIGPHKGTTSGKKKPAPKAAASQKQQKATKAPREKKAKAEEKPAVEDEVCAEELALGEEDEMATSGEQQKEEGHAAAAAAKRRIAQPTKKARNVAAGDKEPEFLGEPVPADEARAKWSQRYQRGSPKRLSLWPSQRRSGRHAASHIGEYEGRII